MKTNIYVAAKQDLEIPSIESIDTLPVSHLQRLGRELERWRDGLTTAKVVSLGDVTVFSHSALHNMHLSTFQKRVTNAVQKLAELGAINFSVLMQGRELRVKGTRPILQEERTAWKTKRAELTKTIAYINKRIDALYNQKRIGQLVDQLVELSAAERKEMDRLLKARLDSLKMVKPKKERG